MESGFYSPGRRPRSVIKPISSTFVGGFFCRHMADREKKFGSPAPCLNNELTFTRFYTRASSSVQKREKGGAGRRTALRALL